MIHYTKYAEQKFDILNEYNVFITKEQVEEVIAAPEKVAKKANCLAARKEGIKVVYQKKAGCIKIITFYPVKQA